jgi:AAA+ ATPase superfamily predicted ATPase
VNDLIEILNERSRTAEHQPSLRYIRDAAQNLNIALSRRHNLIFGRRGAGKTALMVEAKKILEQRGATAFWMNVQPMRRLSAYEAFLTTVSRLCDIPALIHSTRRSNSLSVKQSAALKAKINELLTSDKISEKDVNLLLPELQQILSIFVQ